MKRRILGLVVDGLLYSTHPEWMPRAYGLAVRWVDRDAMLFYPIPLNYVVRFGYSARRAFWIAMVRLGLKNPRSYEIISRSAWSLPWRGSRSLWAIRFLNEHGIAAWRARYPVPRR